MRGGEINSWRKRRAGLGLVFLIGALLAQTSISTAQPPGSELAQDVSSELAGAEASVLLQDVSTFPGGVQRHLPSRLQHGN